MKSLLLLVSLQVILACSFGSLAAAPPTSPTGGALQGISVSFENVAIVIPTGVGAGATAVKTNQVEMPPFVNPSGGAMPVHIVFTINGYPLGREARITVFKASDFASYSGYTNNVINELHSLNFRAGGTLPSDLTGTFSAQAQPVVFQNGHGLRLVTEILQGFAPITNDQTYYFYQGITNDGTYFVMAVLPVSIAFLSPTSDSSAPLPPDGIKFPPFGNPNSTSDDLKAYYGTIADKINSASPNQFTPPLSTLDALIQSISNH